MPEKEQIKEGLDLAAETYERLVEEHGFVKGTVKYYKNLIRGGH